MRYASKTWGFFLSIYSSHVTILSAIQVYRFYEMCQGFMNNPVQCTISGVTRTTMCYPNCKNHDKTPAEDLDEDISRLNNQQITIKKLLMEEKYMIIFIYGTAKTQIPSNTSSFRNPNRTKEQQRRNRSAPVLRGHLSTQLTTG